MSKFIRIKKKLLNESHPIFVDDFHNQQELLEQIRSIFQNFSNTITLELSGIDNTYIKDNSFYESVCLKTAPLIIEQYLAQFIKINFMQNMPVTLVINNTRETGEGFAHTDLIITFKIKNKEIIQNFEIKCYNQKFSDNTLSNKLRAENTIHNPIYIMCHYQIDNNQIIILSITLILGDDIQGNFIDSNSLPNIYHQILNNLLYFKQNISNCLSKNLGHTKY